MLSKQINLKAVPGKLAGRALLFIILLLPGCASTINYPTLNRQVHAGDCAAALEALEKKRSSYGFNMRLNYLLDASMINLRCGNYPESNAYFHKAEDLAQKLWTRSITKEVASFIINDYTLPYSGEDFERAMVNLLSALNYSMLGNIEEALVECRRLDALLLSYNDKYDKKNVYKEDAFGRFLSGILYEAEGNLDDAYIDYYKAFKTFEGYAKNYGTPVPAALKESLVRLAGATERKDEVRKLLDGTLAKKGVTYRETKKMGRLVMVHLNGTSPVKQEEKLVIASLRGPISIAFPRYLVTPPACGGSRIEVRSEDFYAEAESELVEDINAIAVKNLDDRKGRVIAKTLARAAIKQVVISKATENDAVKALFNLLNTAIVEKADKRSWRTLPGEIYLSTMYLPEGVYSATAESCGSKRDYGDIEIKKGEVKFLIYDTI